MKKALVLLGKSTIVVMLVISGIAGQSAGANPTKEGAAEADGGFCGPRVARDFLRPLAKMVPIRHVPSSGKLPFGPKGLTLEALGGRLAVGEDWVGFGFSDEAVGRVRHLNWDVSAQLLEVNSRGAVIANRDSKRRHLGSARSNRIRNLMFRVPERPAFYRIAIRFRRRGENRVLGEFSSYIRAVRPSFDARLLMLGSVARQGEVLSARLANYGTEPVSSISHNWRFAVEYFDGKDWVAAPSNPSPKKHKLIIQRLPAGQMNECIHFRVPDDEKPDSYRFSMVVERTTVDGTENRVVQVTTDFEVSGRSLK